MRPCACTWPSNVSLAATTGSSRPALSFLATLLGLGGCLTDTATFPCRGPNPRERLGEVATYFDKELIELGLNAANRKISFIFGSIDRVEWGTAIKHVLPLGVAPEALLSGMVSELRQIDQIIQRVILDDQVALGGSALDSQANLAEEHH